MTHDRISWTQAHCDGLKFGNLALAVQSLVKIRLVSEAGASNTRVLERLNSIQTLDVDLDALKLEETRIPGDLKAAREEKERLDALLAKLRDDHQAVRREYNTADMDIKARAEQLKRAEADIKTASSTKEQTQYAERIRQLRDDINDLENDSLPVVERMEALEAKIKDLEGQLEALMPKLTELEGMDESRIAALRDQFDTKMIERNAIAEDIDFKLLREYDSVRKAKKGLGLVPIKAGGKCGGCNVVLPINIQQRVRSGVFPVKCQSCGRLLWPGESS